MYSHSLLKSKKLNSCLKIVFYNIILISKKKKKKTIVIKMCYNTKKRKYGDDKYEKIDFDCNSCNNYSEL